MDQETHCVNRGETWLVTYERNNGESSARGEVLEFDQFGLLLRVRGLMAGAKPMTKLIPWRRIYVMELLEAA